MKRKIKGRGWPMVAIEFAHAHSAQVEYPALGGRVAGSLPDCVTQAGNPVHPTKICLGVIKTSWT